VLRRRVDERSCDHLSLEFASAFHGGVKVLDLKPEDDAVPDRSCGGIDEVGVNFLVPGV